MLKKDIHFFRQFSNLNHPFSEEEKNSHGVMVALIVEEKLLLVKRAESMPSHKGQVALIGGHRHEHENFPYETAKREFREETSLDPLDIEIITPLPVVYTARNVPILPLLAHYKKDLESLKKGLLSNGEWETAFLVDISHLFSDHHWVEANRISRTQKQNLLFCSLFKQDITLLKGEAKYPLILWGASARVVETLKNLILTKS